MSEYVRPLAELIVRFGANVQPGQIVSVSSQPGKEELARAVAEVAYEAGAKFVEVNAFDPLVKRARLLHADPDTLGFVPPWYGQRVQALGEHRAAQISLAGPAMPHALAGIDPSLAGRDRLPSVAEFSRVLNQRTVNWVVAPCPTAGWASIVHPDLDADQALAQLWDEIATVCRLKEDDPVAVWCTRLDALAQTGKRLNELKLDQLRFEGPGTSLEMGLLPSSHWGSGQLQTVDGLTHAGNLPTEEVFTTPDPERVQGTVRSTKPLFTAGVIIEGLTLRFEGGRAVEIEAESGAGTLRSLTETDAGSARLGEVALVDRDSRIGQLGTIFYDTLLDENAASHIALGQGLAFAVGEDDLGAMNDSDIHVDFMIGSEEVAVTGVTADGREVPLLRDGRWQV